MASPKYEEETTESKSKRKIRDSAGRRTTPKLIFNAEVEVRSMKQQFQGTWNVGKVVAFKKRMRFIKYKHILSSGENIINGSKYGEWISISPAIDGFKFTNQTYRGNIRPLPPPPPSPRTVQVNQQLWSFSNGKCVDVFYCNAWWEGVILDDRENNHDDDDDVNDSVEIRVFFPDFAEQMRFQVNQMRITQSWNELTGKWKPRGTWLLVKLIQELEKELPIFDLVRQYWYKIRRKEEFKTKIRDWTNSCSSLRGTWQNLLDEVCSENFKITTKDISEVSEVEVLKNETISSLKSFTQSENNSNLRP